MNTLRGSNSQWRKKLEDQVLVLALLLSVKSMRIRHIQITQQCVLSSLIL